MKLNVSYPVTGALKTVEVEDERNLRPFYDKRVAQEVDADSLGDEWKVSVSYYCDSLNLYGFQGYVFRITGGNDKQGFPMKQGVLTNGRVRLLLSKGHSCYRPRRRGERKRKSVRGCIVDANMSALNVIVVKKGDGEIEGLTDVNVPRRFGPKRATKIRRLFNLSKEDDVRQYVIKKVFKPKEGQERPRFVTPKIQRLVTPARLARKRKALASIKKKREQNREARAEYEQVLAKYQKEQKALRRRRSSASQSKSPKLSTSK